MFTLNFTGAVPDLNSIYNAHKGAVGYMLWQHERVNHDHLQGYIQMRRSVRPSYVKKIFRPHQPHIEVARSSHELCVEYCSKHDSRINGPWICGVPVVSGSNKRSLIERYTQSPERMMLEDPHKYRRVEVHLKNQRFVTSPMECPFDHQWQRELDEVLSRPPDDRTIVWVYGPHGADGKTCYAKKLAKSGWYYSKGGRKDNVIYQYMTNIDRNVVLDVPRESKEYIQYDLLEMLKDRMLISNKYEPLVGMSDTNVHVVVMSNFLPDISKISADRLLIIHCTGENHQNSNTPTSSSS